MEESPMYHVPEGMSLTDCYYTIDGNAGHSTEVMFRNSKEAPGYDCRNTTHYSCDHVSVPGEASSCSTLLFDMVQASQQLETLNYGSCFVSEFSGLTPFRKSYPECYSSRSQEETDTRLRPLVNEIEDVLICSRSSSPGIPQLLGGRDGKTALTVTASKVTGDEGIQECDEAAVTGLVMEKILRDHFQNTSERSSYPSTTPASSSSNDPPPSFCGRTVLQDCSLVESTRTSSSRIEFGMSQEPAPSQQLDEVAHMGPSEFTLVRSTFRRPFEVTGSVESTTHRKWNQQRPSGGHVSYQGPYPSFCAPSCEEDKSKTRSKTVTDRLERASSRPKRRRTRINRTDSSAETQRMIHIAVERNRRKQMNDHLSALKALMPSTFVQKTDQASIIGGAVEFVKELEVLLQSLLSKQLRRRSYAAILGTSWTRFNVHPGLLQCAPYTAGASSARPRQSTTATSEDPIGRFSSKRKIMGSELLAVLPETTRATNEVRAECRSTAATVDVKVLENDAIVNITTNRRAKQLVKVIVALESLNLNILHISVTTSNNTVLYTINAKVGPECRMSVNHIAAMLHQTFNSIHVN